MYSYLAPVQLTEKHAIADFRSGEEALDKWLVQRALENIKNAASKTYVICPADSNKVIGYYALSMGQIVNADVVGSMRRNK